MFVRCDLCSTVDLRFKKSEQYFMQQTTSDYCFKVRYVLIHTSYSPLGHDVSTYLEVHRYVHTYVGTLLDIVQFCA
jgi:hypothetical protein